MSVRLENIDELRKRANVSYEEAKEALEMTNDDMLEALIYLEKQNKIKSASSTAEGGRTLWDKIKAVIKKGNETKLVIHKREFTVISLPVTAAVIITIIAPYLTVIGLIIALLTGHRIKFEGKHGNLSNINQTLDKVSTVIDSTKQKLTENN
jgi:hypothetical protein